MHSKPRRPGGAETLELFMDNDADLNVTRRGGYPLQFIFVELRPPGHAIA